MISKAEVSEGIQAPTRVTVVILDIACIDFGLYHY